MSLRAIIILLHSINIIAGAVVTAGHGAWWIGVIVVSSASIGTYLSSQMKNPPLASKK